MAETTIKIRRTTNLAELSDTQKAEVLDFGEPFYDKETKKLYIGDGNSGESAHPLSDPPGVRVDEADVADDISSAPTLANSGNGVTVTVGTKTSSALTIGYASKAGGLSPSGTDGYLLQSGGGVSDPSWVNPSTITVGNATNATNSTNATNATKATYVSSNGIWSFTHSKEGTTHTFTLSDNFSPTANESFVMFGKFVPGGGFTAGDKIRVRTMSDNTVTSSEGVSLTMVNGSPAVTNSFYGGGAGIVIFSTGNDGKVNSAFIHPAVSLWS